MRRLLSRAGAGASGWLALAAVVFLLGSGAALIAVARGVSKPVVEHPPPALAAGSVVDKRVGRLPLIDEHGRATSLGAFRGRWVVLAPSLTLCHEVCPLTTGALDQLQQDVRARGLGDRVVVAEASVDPWRDTPARIRAFKRLTGTDVRFLTGNRPEIARLWKVFGVYYHRVPQDDPPDRDWWTHRAETFDVEHTDGVFIVSPDGHWRVAVLGMPDVSGLPRRLTSLLNDEGRANMRHPDSAWTVAQIESDLWGLMGLATAQRAAASPATADATPSALPEHTNRLVDDSGAFRRRLVALRGRPVVVNEWASWCPPCRQEMPLMAAAAKRYSRNVAFVGLDVNDADDNARSFLVQHPLPYPTYADPHAEAATSLASFVGLPTTVYLDGAGRVQFVHAGAYADAASLVDDVQRHALG